MQKLPVGIQDFAEMRTKDYIYVDKTAYLLQLIATGKYLFFARPRRFGKSLLCSTLHYLFEGRKELFEGLYIYDKIDWEDIKHPVIYIDFSETVFNTVSLQEALQIQLDSIANNLQISLPHKSPELNFQYLIQKLAREVGKVVILIDEYDKALTDFLDNPEKFKEHRDFLRGFYGILKPSDKYIEMVFMTGVSKYGKLSVFSALNNIADISLDEEFVCMCGYTPEELEDNFQVYIDLLAKKFNRPKADLLAEMQLRYNGYSFDGEHSVYNPYAILRFFQSKEFKNFWFETGSPYFLIELLRKEKVKIEILENIKSNAAMLSIAEVDNQSIISLLFQTGYLTIKEGIRHYFDLIFVLDFPNIEVKQAFAQYVLSDYFHHGQDLIHIEIAEPIRKAFYERNMDKLIDVMQNQVYAQVPYQLYENKEAYYHTIFHVALNTAGFRTQSEVQSNIGRMDMVVETYDTVFIFEFKLDESAEIAIAQIQAKQYYQKYLLLNYPIYVIGVNFSSEKRNIVAYQIIQVM